MPIYPAIVNYNSILPSEIGSLAFRALLEEIDGARNKTDYEYKTRFVLRESTCAPKL